MNTKSKFEFFKKKKITGLQQIKGGAIDTSTTVGKCTRMDTFFLESEGDRTNKSYYQDPKVVGDLVYCLTTDVDPIATFAPSTTPVNTFNS